MVRDLRVPSYVAAILGALLVFGVAGLLLAGSAQPVQSFDLETAEQEITAPCAGGPTIDGILLDECHIEAFTVGGVNKTITVWYTQNATTANRTLENGSVVTLSHWINTDAQAQQVGDWGREAWVRYYAIFNRHPYDTGCGNNINVQLEDGVGWAGIAYWAGPGSCWIGIDSPTIRSNDGQWVVYHEFQHYQQYSFDSGCYGYLKPHYPDDSEFIEGYADLASDAVDATLDVAGYAGITYNPKVNMFDYGYGNLFNKYFIEQLGSSWTTVDPWFHMDAMREHYVECDARDTLYVFDTLIPRLKPGMNEEKLFMNFFAANWAKKWANPATQSELVYFDDDVSPYADIPIQYSWPLAGSKAWTGHTTPDKWAGYYYEVEPQATCSYVTAKVTGEGGAHLGINLMAADTAAPASVERYAWAGETFARTFRGYGVYNKIAASVNAFATQYDYDISFDCVTPSVEILEPVSANPVQVGEVSAPIAFLARLRVNSGGSPVLGLTANLFKAEAEGDEVAILPGTFQQVGEEYWAILLPPTKPAGTTYVDLQVCLDGGSCDTESNALLYEPPGNNDFALVFDASGSMSEEDMLGEGTRLENAQKAGTVMADLLREGDRVLVTDFSAFDNPAGCGATTHNCALDLVTRLSRTNVTAPVATIIDSVKIAIADITAREWTPIGAALKDAKNQLVAGPDSGNPKHIILLSDGEENVNPYYSTVQAELVASGVKIDTIGFSGDAPQALLAQIAADTGGVYRYVPTTGGTFAAQDVEAQTLELEQMGVPASLAAQVTTDLLPGPLGLDNVYDYFDTLSQDASRVLHVNHVGASTNEFKYGDFMVDESASSLRIVVGAKQADYDLTGEGLPRTAAVLPPGADPKIGWIEISPPSRSAPPPADWDIRNSIYDDVVIIPKPAPGIWRVRATYLYFGEFGALTFDVMLNASVDSDIRLKGRFLAPMVNNQGQAGDAVPIVGVLLDKNGTFPLPGVYGVDHAVIANIQKPGVPQNILLFDDGSHNDGAAGDGIYGNIFSQTAVGGSYNVLIMALWKDPATGQLHNRQWLGGFWIDGPGRDDADKDGLPDDWERRCQIQETGRDGDPDRDGLVNYAELQHGTSPCDPDTDNGGERDGSEVSNQRNPLYAPDDLVRRPSFVRITPLNRQILVRWTQPYSSTYTTMRGFLSIDPNALGDPFDLGTTGIYTMTGLTNDQTYYLTLAAVNGAALSEFVGPEAVTPKEDPDPPSGDVLINMGEAFTRAQQVLLNITATDTPLEGLADGHHANTHRPSGSLLNTPSWGIEMRIANDPLFNDAPWEPFTPQKLWMLSGSSSGAYQVYIQFRDAAGNLSVVDFDEIRLQEVLFLPLVNKR